MTTNIGGTLNDSFHRYKMSNLQLTQKGKNQSTETIIENFTKICMELHRAPVQLQKYIGYSLNVQIKYKDPKLQIHGDHNKSDLDSIIESYITDYILCKKCKNPETSIVRNSKIYALNCIACGAVTELNNTNKLNMKYNEYLSKLIKSSDITLTQLTEVKSTKNKNTLEDPLIILTEFMKQPHTPHDIYSELLRIQKARTCNEYEISKLAFKLHSQYKININEVLKLLNYEINIVLNSLVDVLIELKNEKQLVTVLEVLRDENYTEEQIKLWIVLEQYDIKIKPYILKYLTWLNEAEEEED